MISIKSRAPYLFAAPFLILFLGFFVAPVFYAAYLSLFKDVMGTSVFVGLQNYVTALQDSGFWVAMGRVTYFGVVQVTSMLFISLSLALLLDSPYVRGASLWRLIYILPYAVPGVIAGLMWGFLFAPGLDPLLTTIHIAPLASSDILYTIMFIVTWEWAGYNMTLYLSSLTTIPLELYDAAKIDGCTEWQLAWRVKVPLLRPTLIMTIVLSIIGSLQLFNEPFILSSLTAIPSTYTPNMDIYNYAFSFNVLPYAATLSVILAVVTIIASVVFLRLTRDRSGHSDQSSSALVLSSQGGV